MFRTPPDPKQSAVIRATLALLLVILAATGVTVWLIAEIRKEQRAVDAIVHDHSEAGVAALGSLSGELRWQFILTSLVLVVLAMAAIALLFTVRAYSQSQASLQKVKMLAWDILASTDQGVITTDRDGRITSVNPRSQEFLGLEAECDGRTLHDICGAESPLVAACSEVLKTGVAVSDVDFSTNRNGHETRLQADCYLLRGNSEALLGTVIHIRDVTERVLTEDRIRRMERFMGLGTLAAGLHHEIKNPLGALSLHVQLLEERLDGQADDEVAENLRVLKTEVTRIAGVLQSFRDYASSDRMHLAPADIQSLLQHTVDLMGPKANQQNVRLELVVPDEGLPVVKLDAVRFEQVLLNLVINALEVLRTDGTVTLSARCSATHLRLEVTDTGTGIPNNIRSMIFDPYFTTKSGGSGMGLALCDKIVRQHGGAIDVETSSAGTTFRILLPVIQG